MQQCSSTSDRVITMDEIRQAIEIGDITKAIDLVKEWGVYEDELKAEIARLNN